MPRGSRRWIDGTRVANHIVQGPGAIPGGEALSPGAGHERLTWKADASVPHHAKRPAGVPDRRYRDQPRPGFSPAMDPRDLIAAAAALARPFVTSDDCTSGDVAAALVTEANSLYTGVC